MRDIINVATPSGESLWVEYVYESCLIVVEGRETTADLLVLEMVDLDIILGMDWLASCHATVDCRSKKIKFEMPGEPPFELYGDGAPNGTGIIFALTARQLLNAGC